MSFLFIIIFFDFFKLFVCFKKIEFSFCRIYYCGHWRCFKRIMFVLTGCLVRQPVAASTTKSHGCLERRSWSSLRSKLGPPLRVVAMAIALVFSVHLRRGRLLAATLISNGGPYMNLKDGHDRLSRQPWLRQSPDISPNNH